MIKPITCVCMVLAAGSGLYLYQSKHRAQLLDREIQRTLKQIETVKERTVALTNEWAVLQETDRLTELSQKHLGLRTLAPTQFVSLADAALRLPAPVAPGTVANPPEEPPALALPVRPATAPAPATPPANGQAVPAAAPVQLAEVRPPRPATPRPAPAIAPVAAPAVPAPPPAALPPSAASRAALAPLVSVAAAPIVGRPAPVPRAPVLASATGPAPGSIGEAVLRAGIIKMPVSSAVPTLHVAAPAPSYATPSYATPSYAAPSYATPAYAPASYGSALGGVGRAALPPPTPYSAR